MTKTKQEERNASLLQKLEDTVREAGIYAELAARCARNLGVSAKEMQSSAAEAQKRANAAFYAMERLVKELRT